MTFYHLIFYLSFLCAFYTYILYPAILFLVLTLMKQKDSEPLSSAFTPSVSILIAAYNEEKVIQQKIQNSLNLIYPANKCEVLIGSDGSTDQTDAKCQANTKVRFFKLNPRQGKPSVLNHLSRYANGEIFVFSDANSILRKDCLSRIVQHFQDPSVGAVSGRLILDSANSSLASYEKHYWQYETFLKVLESKIYSTVAANGGIYALRKSLYSEIPSDTITDDFTITLNVLERGKRVLFEQEAVAYEHTSRSLRDEFWRKVRIGAGNLQALVRKRRVFKYAPLFPKFSYLSHKVIRWFVPFFLLAAYFSLYKLSSNTSFFVLFMLFNAGITCSIFALFFRNKNRFLNLLAYFFITNIALFYGYFRYLFGLQRVTWRKASR